MQTTVYHVSVTTIGKAASRRHLRQRSRSSASAAQYISRTGQYSVGHDSALHVESGNMPSWGSVGKSAAAKRASLAYWRAADSYERKNGRLALSFIIALPRELPVEHQIALSRIIAAKLASTTHEGKLPWTFAIHPGASPDRPSNPHLHLLISERICDGIDRTPSLWFRRPAVRLQPGPVDPAKGGARKTFEMRTRLWLLEVRALIADVINRALEAIGSRTRVDHRTNAARGLERQPQPTLGWPASGMEKRGIRTSQGDALLRVKRSWKGSNLPIGPVLASRPHDIKLDVSQRPSVREWPSELSSGPQNPSTRKPAAQRPSPNTVGTQNHPMSIRRRSPKSAARTTAVSTPAVTGTPVNDPLLMPDSFGSAISLRKFHKRAQPISTPLAVPVRATESSALPPPHRSSSVQDEPEMESDLPQLSPYDRFL
jgi:MobA/MobL family